MEHKFENIIYEKTENKAKITLNRPHVRNALNRELIGEYIRALGMADKDKSE